MNRRCEGSPHLPLHVIGQGLVGLLQEGPVGPAQGKGHSWQGKCAMPRDIVVDCLSAARVDHGDIVVDQELGYD